MISATSFLSLLNLLQVISSYRQKLLWSHLLKLSLLTASTMNGEHSNTKNRANLKDFHDVN
jgi:hypothetical protein